MWGDLIRTIDRVLRGHFTQRADLAEGRISVPARTLVASAIALGCTYGVFMGLFALLRGGGLAGNAGQFLATVVKVPLLFLLTLLVTFPSLYVVSALFDSRLRFFETLRLLVLAILVDLALLASLGPVTGFFTLSTESYPFMVLLNVVLFAIAGLAGLGFLRKALGGVFGGALHAAAAPAEGAAGAEPSAPPRQRVGAPEQRVFRVWLLIYAVVGAQMGWILRPFIGHPGLPFQLFRSRESNFFQAVLESIRQLGQ